MLGTTLVMCTALHAGYSQALKEYLCIEETASSLVIREQKKSGAKVCHASACRSPHPHNVASGVAQDVRCQQGAELRGTQEDRWGEWEATEVFREGEGGGVHRYPQHQIAMQTGSASSNLFWAERNSKNHLRVGGGCGPLKEGLVTGPMLLSSAEGALVIGCKPANTVFLRTCF